MDAENTEINDERHCGKDFSQLQHSQTIKKANQNARQINAASTTRGKTRVENLHLSLLIG